jgi:hypothetical protein
MGYYIFSYAINTDKVLASIGSGDNNLYNKILKTDTFNLYSDQDFAGHTTTKEALENLIFGRKYFKIFARKYNKKSAHAYWYALIVICSYLGEALPATHEIKLGYETDLINGYLKSDFDISMIIEEELLVNGNDPFDLPSVQDWPLSGLLNRADLISLQQKFISINITDDMVTKLLEKDEEIEMAYDSIKQIKENISYCLENSLDLISFCH